MKNNKTQTNKTIITLYKQKIKMMNLKMILSAGALFFSAVAFPQTGNVGIGTTLPGSKLTIAGSLAAPYKLVTATGTVGANDFYTAYNSSADGTLTLPAATAAAPAAGNILGRLYHFKNTGTATLTVAASGTELIDNQAGAGVANFTLVPGGYAMLISKGTTGAATTWELALIKQNFTATIISMAAANSVSLPLAGFNAGTPQIIPFAATDLQVNQGGTAVWNDAGDYFSILETGVYEVSGLAHFSCSANSTGINQWIGVNINISKNGTALANIVGGNRVNIMQPIVDDQGNTPIPVKCIISLVAGDKLYLTMNWGFGRKAAGSVDVQAPNNLVERSQFSLRQL
jgi:hypothetical protein